MSYAIFSGALPEAEKLINKKDVGLLSFDAVLAISLLAIGVLALIHLNKVPLPADLAAIVQHIQFPVASVMVILGGSIVVIDVCKVVMKAILRKRMLEMAAGAQNLGTQVNQDLLRAQNQNRNDEQTILRLHNQINELREQINEFRQQQQNNTPLVGESESDECESTESTEEDHQILQDQIKIIDELQKNLQSKDKYIDQLEKLASKSEDIIIQGQHDFRLKDEHNKGLIKEIEELQNQIDKLQNETKSNVKIEQLNKLQEVIKKLASDNLKYRGEVLKLLEIGKERSLKKEEEIKGYKRQIEELKLNQNSNSFVPPPVLEISQNNEAQTFASPPPPPPPPQLQGISQNNEAQTFAPPPPPPPPLKEVTALEGEIEKLESVKAGIENTKDFQIQILNTKLSSNSNEVPPSISHEGSKYIDNMIAGVKAPDTKELFEVIHDYFLRKKERLEKQPVNTTTNPGSSKLIDIMALLTEAQLLVDSNDDEMSALECYHKIPVQIRSYIDSAWEWIEKAGSTEEKIERAGQVAQKIKKEFIEKIESQLRKKIEEKKQTKLALEKHRMEFGEKNKQQHIEKMKKALEYNRYEITKFNPEKIEKMARSNVQSVLGIKAQNVQLDPEEAFKYLNNLVLEIKQKHNELLKSDLTAVNHEGVVLFERKCTELKRYIDTIMNVQSLKTPLMQKWNNYETLFEA